MPIYEYKCAACHKEFEIIQKFSEEPLSKCPECGGAVSKLISNTSFVLKGGGWYADGYGSSKAGSSEKSTIPPAPDSSAKAPAESKPAEAASAPTPKPAATEKAGSTA